MTQCEIIGDLLPLYCDDACSPASRALVEEHLGGCEACRAELAELQAPLSAEPVPAQAAQGKGLRTAKRKLMRKAVLSVVAVLCAMAIFTAAGASLYTAFERERIIPLSVAGDLFNGVGFADAEDGKYQKIQLDFREKRYLRASCLFRRVTIDGEVRDIAILQMTQSWTRKYLDTAVDGPEYVPLGAGTELYLAAGALYHDVAYGKEYEPEYWNPAWRYRGNLSAIYYLAGINTPQHLADIPEANLLRLLDDNGALVWKDGDLQWIG